jgi:hypothetical protein
MSTTTEQPDDNALEQAKRDYATHVMHAIGELSDAANYEIRLSKRNLSAQAAQVRATLAVAAATRLHAEALLTAAKADAPPVVSDMPMARPADLHGTRQYTDHVQDVTELANAAAYAARLRGRVVTAVRFRRDGPNITFEAWTADEDAVSSEDAPVVSGRAQRRDARDTARHGGQLDGGDEVGGPWMDEDAPRGPLSGPQSAEQPPPRGSGTTGGVLGAPEGSQGDTVGGAA